MNIDEAIQILSQQTSAEWLVIRLGLRSNERLRRLKERVKTFFDDNSYGFPKRGTMIVNRILNTPEVEFTYNPTADTARIIKFRSVALNFLEDRLDDLEKML